MYMTVERLALRYAATGKRPKVRVGDNVHRVRIVKAAGSVSTYLVEFDSGLNGVAHCPASRRLEVVS